MKDAVALVPGTEYWMGDASSLQMHEAAYARGMEAFASSSLHDEGEEEDSWLLTRAGPIAVVNISGSLTNTDQPWFRYAGITSYGEISRALSVAAADSSIQHIILDINSGGGSAYGMIEVAQLVRHINDNVKPVSAFNAGVMASAAYAIGCAAGKRYVSTVSTTGSIGVIATLVDRSEAMKNEGYEAYVFRGGAYKALAHPLEPMTEAASQQVQEAMDALYEAFITHVSEMLGVSVNIVHAQMADGREFHGAQAVRAGLVEGVTNFTTLFQGLTESIDASKNSIQNRTQFNQGGFSMKLSAAQIAVLASGGKVEGFEAAAPNESETKAETKAENIPGMDPAAGLPETPPVADKGDLQADAKLAEMEVDLKAATKLAKESGEALLAAQVEISKMKEASAAHAALADIARASISNMRVALNMPTQGLDSLPAADLPGLYAATRSAFEAALPVGGRSVSSADEKEAEPKVDTARHMALSRAAGFKKSI